MPKMKLDLDALQIESFDTSETDAERGTVRGHDASDRLTVCQESCAGTCYTHCWGECGDGGTEHGPTVTTCTQILNCEVDPFTRSC
jgi:hypothetical protein